MIKNQKSFIKNIVGFSLASYVGAAISLVSVPIVTRLYSAAEIGKINLFLTYLSIIGVFCFMGFDNVLVRYYNEPPNNYKSANLSYLCLVMSMIFIIPVSIVIYIFKNNISLIISGINGYIVPVCLIISLLGNVVIRYSTLISRMEQNILAFSVQSILSIVITKFIYILSAIYLPNYSIAIMSLTSSYFLLGLLFFVWNVKNNLISNEIRFNKETIINLSKYALPTVPAFFIAIMSNSLSQLMLKKYVGYSAIGVYSNAVTVAGILSLVQSGFNIYWPAYVFSFYKTEIQKILKIHKFISYIMIMSALIMILFQDMIYLFIGINFRSSKYFFPLLLVTPVVYTIAETTKIGIRIAKKTYWEIVVYGFILLTNYMLCILLIPIYGVNGAAWSSAITSIVGLLAMTVISRKYYRSFESYAHMTCGIVILLCAAIINFMFYEHVLLKNTMVLFLILILSVLYYKEFIYIYRIINVFVKNKFKF